MNEVAHFQRWLAETMAWCAAQDWAYNPAEGLRTSLLRPERTEDGYMIWDWQPTSQQRRQIVERLAVKRADLVQGYEILSHQHISPLTEGRLLVFNFHDTLSEGTAYCATDGFFDGDNGPAWDTWIAYVINDPVSNPPWHSFDSYLLSWVPEPLVDIAAAGIDATWEHCLLWAEDVDSKFVCQLRSAGLLR